MSILRLLTSCQPRQSGKEDIFRYDKVFFDNY